MKTQKSQKTVNLKQGGRDSVFDEDWKPGDFAFDDKVASVFDDMVTRSVPLYDETRAASLELAGHFVQPNTNVYDIGCSTATLLSTMASQLEDPSVHLIGIDNSAAMLDQARAKIVREGLQDRIELKKADVEGDLNMNNASVIFMNYTLQFVRPLYREGVLRQINDALKPNGCLILVEKVLGNDSLFNRLYIDLYYAYKARVGYSDTEIRQKREALENVLIPYRIDENVELLQRTGFGSVDIFFKWYNFAGFVAVKTE